MESVIYTNGAIWTGDPARPWAEALWVTGETIAAVGTEEDVAARAAETAGTRVVDLGGAYLMPGLVDAHAHVQGFGLGLDRVDLVGTTSLQETLERVRRRVVQAREAGHTGWIRGRGWDQNDWAGHDFPTARDLDRVSETYPVVLTRIDGHAYWVNSRALAVAGIKAGTADPPGGRVLRDAKGEPTGVLVDAAKDLVLAVMPEVDAATKARGIRLAARAMARAGLTGAHDMGMSEAELAIYRSLADEGALGVRIYASISATDPHLDRVLAAGPDRTWRDGCFKLGMVKFYVDGALGSRGAALLEPYSDEPGNRGLFQLPPDSLRAGMQAALAAGFQCAVHAIGDAANRAALDAWESISGGDPAAFAHPVPEAPASDVGDVPSRIPPVRIEHAQVVAPEDLPRFGRLGVVASMQPTHATSDLPWAGERLGKERLRGAYAWRTLVDEGAVLAAGSDFPVESHDPRFGLYAAVTRRAVEGGPAGGWSPEERLTRNEALVAFTAAPAYVSGDLDRLGTLTPGKLADFVVFDRNLATCDPERILTARTLLTVVGGRVLWADPEGPLSGLETEEVR